jgi:hypothetical protein
VEDWRASWNYNEAGVSASFEVGSRELRDDVVGVERNAGREKGQDRKLSIE